MPDILNDTDDFDEPLGPRNFREEAARLYAHGFATLKSGDYMEAIRCAKEGILSLPFCGQDFDDKDRLCTGFLYLHMAAEVQRGQVVIENIRKHSNGIVRKLTCIDYIDKLVSVMSLDKEAFLWNHLDLLPSDVTPFPSILQLLNCVRAELDKLHLENWHN